MKEYRKRTTTKRSQKKRLLASAAAVFTAAALAGGSVTVWAKEESDAELNQADHLNIALQPIPGYLPVSLLQDKGWVEEALQDAGYEDVKVTYTEFESGPPENESFASGAQDIGVMGNVPTLSAVAAGQERTILGVAYNGEKTEAVLVAKDSDISSVADLKGKKVGLVVGSIAQDFFERLLESEGIKADEVQLVNLASTEQKSALASGQVDAIAVWQPMIAQVEAAETGKVLVDGSELYKCENLISGNTDYIKENPEIVQIFLDQYKRAAEEVSSDTETYAESYAEKYALEAAIVNATISDMNFPVTIEEEDIEDLQQTADWLYDSGNVKEKVTVQDVVDTDFAGADTASENTEE